MAVTLSTKPPGTTEFIAMRAACGWGEISEDMARRALGQAVATVTADDGDSLIGLGRVVGDGALFFYLQDIIVSPMQSLPAFLTKLPPFQAPDRPSG